MDILIRPCYQSVSIILLMIYHPHEWQQSPKVCVLWGISQRETSSWWATSAIQRFTQTTPKGYTYRCIHLGGSCTRSTSVVAGHSQRKQLYWRKYITQIPTWSQSPSWLSWCFCPAPIIFCVNCGRGFKSQIGLFSYQRAKHVTDETLHWCHHRATMDSKEEDPWRVFHRYTKQSWLLQMCSFTHKLSRSYSMQSKQLTS